AGDAGDVRRQAGGVAIDVLAVARRNGERAGGGAVGDADVALVGVGGAHTLTPVRQSRREQVAAAGALIDGGRGEVDGGRGDGVDHGGRGCTAFPYTTLFRSAGDAGDVRRQAGGVAIDVLAVARGNGERAGGGAVGDGDVALV